VWLGKVTCNTHAAHLAACLLSTWSSTPANEQSQMSTDRRMKVLVGHLQQEAHDLLLSPSVRQALTQGGAVVALESTIITHGMPFPQNLQTAREVERIIRDAGAEPATIAILDGRPCVGTSHSLHCSCRRLPQA
jgi:hypothetical protein